MSCSSKYAGWVRTLSRVDVLRVLESSMYGWSMYVWGKRGCTAHSRYDGCELGTHKGCRKKGKALPPALAGFPTVSLASKWGMLGCQSCLGGVLV